MSELFYNIAIIEKVYVPEQKRRVEVSESNAIEKFTNIYSKIEW